MVNILTGRYDIDHIHTNLGDLSDFIASRWGGMIGSRSGADTAIECPQHKPGHTTSAHVHRYPDGRQTFKCWRCDIGPVDVIDLLVEMGDAHNRGDAIRQLADLMNLERTDNVAPTKPARRGPQVKRVVPMDATVDEVDTSEAGKQRVAAYCAWRGWPPETADRFRLASVRRFDGWRIRHPFLSSKGEVLAAQDYKRNTDRRWWSAKGSTLTLYGQQTLRYIDDMVPIIDVCEGISDCVTVAAAMGFNHAVVGAPGASSWRAQHSEAFAKCQLVVWPDNDDAGQTFADRIIKASKNTTRLSRPVKIGRIPQEYDDVHHWMQSTKPDFAGDFRSARYEAWSAK